MIWLFGFAYLLRKWSLRDTSLVWDAYPATLTRSSDELVDPWCLAKAAIPFLLIMLI